MQDRKENAARAAWLYFVRGYTQDEVAWHLGLSRPTTQRLISFAVSEELVRFKVDHPIVGCMALGAQVAKRYGLDFCDVAPADPKATDAREIIAPYVAERILRLLPSRPRSRTRLQIVLVSPRQLVEHWLGDQYDAFVGPAEATRVLIGVVPGGDAGDPAEVGHDPEAV